MCTGVNILWSLYRSYLRGLQRVLLSNRHLLVEQKAKNIDYGCSNSGCLIMQKTLKPRKQVSLPHTFSCTKIFDVTDREWCKEFVELA